MTIGPYYCGLCNYHSWLALRTECLDLPCVALRKRWLNRGGFRYDVVTLIDGMMMLNFVRRRRMLSRWMIILLPGMDLEKGIGYDTIDEKRNIRPIVGRRPPRTGRLSVID